MPLYLNESQHNDDESFYENMVDEMYNPINYNFSDGDVTKASDGIKFNMGHTSM